MRKLLQTVAFVVPLAVAGTLWAQPVEPAPANGGSYDKAVQDLRKPGQVDVAPFGTMKANPSQTGVQPAPSPKEQELYRQEVQRLHQEQQR